MVKCRKQIDSVKYAQYEVGNPSNLLCIIIVPLLVPVDSHWECSARGEGSGSDQAIESLKIEMKVIYFGE